MKNFDVILKKNQQYKGSPVKGMKAKDQVKCFRICNKD